MTFPFIQHIDVLACLLTMAHLVDGVPRFTRHPPSVLFMSSGDTARFVWDYEVNNRTTELDLYSPEWSFYNKSGEKVTIGMDDGLKGWGFVINKNCPSRLLNPTRVSKESTATLVISNVTTADSGMYGCSLILTTGSPITSKVLLVVTDRPRFISPISPKTLITERSNLSINCSAAGNPLPNVTWVKIGGQRKIIDKGLGSVLLSIVNIKRRYSGMYECQARNNPYDAAVTMQTEVCVSWKPNIDLFNSSTTVGSFDGKKIRLQCKANGQPVPNITWYNPQGLKITKGTNSIHGNSEITIKTTEDSDYGQYQCKASNTAGYDKHVINVTRLFSPQSSIVTISEINVSSVKVTWVSPFHDGGSHVIDYKVQINTKPPREIITENKYQVIKNLMENTTYTVMVYARNIVGYGKASVVKFTTKSQGNNTSQGNKKRRGIGISTVLIVVGGLIIFALLVFVVLIFKRCVKRYLGKSKRKISKTKTDENAQDVTVEGLSRVCNEVLSSIENKEISMPIYAHVDKTKKRCPGQIIYAELSDLTTSEETSLSLPSKYTETHYADIIQGQIKSDLYPVYENFPNN